MALRHGLHQVRLPGEKRGHQHLCIAMHLLEGSRRERTCHPLWSGTVRVAERRIIMRIHPYGRGLMLEGFDPLRHRVHKLMVPATEWNWMGHGHLAWLGPNEKEALCWKLLRRLNAEDGKPCYTGLPGQRVLTTHPYSSGLLSPPQAPSRLTSSRMALGGSGSACPMGTPQSRMSSAALCGTRGKYIWRRWKRR
jgi:hypothetical protein